MSLNQSRLEKNERGFRKPGGGRSSGNPGGGGQQRPLIGGGRGRGRGGGGGGGTVPTTTAPTLPNSRSYKKTNNAQGGQVKATVNTVNSSDYNTGSGSHSVGNGAHVHSSLPGVSSVPAPSVSSKPTDALPQKSSQPTPRVPSSQSSSMTSESTLPSTPTKVDGGKGISLQFGSLSPGFMNGMQVPARTSSAPPNLDEQKRDQARRDASRIVPPVPLPTAPKQDVPKRYVPPIQQPVSQQIHVEPRAKRDVHVVPASLPIQPPRLPAVHMTGVSMPLPFHQPIVPMQFSGPNPQIPSQGMAGSSLQMPTIQMPLQIGNPPQVPQQVFVPGLQPHLMQTKGIMHQGQNLGFNPQMGPQLSHQRGSLGMNMPAQFNQQQPAKFGAIRKTVKITHPDTHEELRLDNRDGGSSGPRPHHSGPQSMSAATVTTTHPVGYYSNPYSAGPPFFPAPSSLPLTSTQLTAVSQVPRFNYPVSQAQPTMPLINQPESNTVSTSGTALHGIPGSSNSVHVREVHSIVPSAQSTSTLVTVEAASGPGGEESNFNANAKVEPHKLLNSTKDPVINKNIEVKADSSSIQPTVPVSLASETSTLESPAESASVVTSVDATKREAISKSSSLGETQKHPSKNEHPEPPPQVKGDSSNVVENKISLPSEAVQASCAVTGEAPTGGRSVDLGTESCTSSSDMPKTQLDSPQVNITLESAVTNEREGKPVVVPNVDSSLKVDDAHKNTAENGKSKKSNNLTFVMEDSQKEAESATSCIGGDKMGKQALVEYDSSNVSADGSIAGSSSSVGMTGNLSCKDYETSNSTTSENEAISISANLSDADVENEKDALGNSRPTSSGSNKSSVETNKTKNNKGKKKRKEMLQKADALGTTSDLYMAYKGVDEKNKTNVTEVSLENSLKEFSADAQPEESKRKTVDEQSKSELDDWEDAAEFSSPRLQPTGSGVYDSEEGITLKKYSRDFLLTFAEQCAELPEGFEISPDMDVLMCVNVTATRDNRDYSSTAKIVDRSAGNARVDRRGSGPVDADRWNKMPGPYPPGRDPGLDLAYGSNVLGFRGGPGPNYGVLRNPRAQGPPFQPVGGILSGPMHSMSLQGIQRNNSDADRWQRSMNFNKGLMPAPQTPLQVMHRAERKYEVGKVTDEEQAKQRKLKSILNRLTPQNFEKLFQQVKDVNIDNVVTLRGVISQIFDKALIEPTFCEMYADFCYYLSSELPNLSVDDEIITFKRLLLNKCQEEFERGEREEKEANDVDGEGEIEQSEQEREEKRLKARRRMLGNIRLIGELYKKRMLTERIMHECIKKLLGQNQSPDEENIEALCKLMSTIGELIDHPRAKEHMDAYFDLMGQLSINEQLSTRLRFMLKDAIDLRKNKWQQRRKVEGPKKIEEVHRDAAQERHNQTARLGRGSNMNPATRRSQAPDFGSRAAMLSSPGGLGLGVRGPPSQIRGYGTQDSRVDERNFFENRTPSVPLPQRTFNNEITLGPQGGLARGMAFRGQPSMTSSALLDSSPSFGDPRRVGSSFNGYNAAADRGAHNSNEDRVGRHTSDRFGAPVAYAQSGTHELNASQINRDFRYPDPNLDRLRPRAPPMSQVGGSSAQNVSSEKVWPEERLRDMSIAAIKEYYSAKDEKEIKMCIKDLKAPSFYPTVISTWVTDSFERKVMERDMLAELLLNLTKPREGMFTPAQLIEGLGSVLNNLEDTVTDAPRAPEYLGQIFGRVVLENVIPLNEVGRLIRESGEEAGHLLEIGLGGDVLGSALEMIKLVKGESVLTQLRASSTLRLQDFQPPHPIRSRKLEMFM